MYAFITNVQVIDQTKTPCLLQGYNGDVHAYIATQEPLSNTIGDFWRMVWEQQSRVIIMLTAVNETSQV